MEWEYVNAPVMRGYVALASLTLSKTSYVTKADLTRRLSLSETVLKAARKFLLMRAQYFKEVTGHGVEMARQMSYLVDYGNDAMFSEVHCVVRDIITTKI